MSDPYNPAGGKTYNLSGSISSTATSFTLSSFLEPVTNTPYTMALLNTQIAFGTLGPKTSSSEFISFTGITQNVNGTATITGVTRGLAKKYPFTTDSAYKLPHSGQTPFILSDAPQVFNEYGVLANDEVIGGQWEGPDPISAQGLVTRDWILALINGGPVNFEAVIEPGIAGETISAGNLIYFSETDNEWLKTDADTLATIFNVKLGIAQGSGVNGGAIGSGVLTYGFYPTSGLVQGDIMYASNTAGAISSTAGTVPRVIGIAKDANNLYFDPNFQNRLYDYAIDSVGTDAYAVTMPAALSVPFVGMEINFKAGTANTGACTIAINGGSALAIVKNVSDALETGDILINQIVKIIYNGTSWQMISPGQIASTSAKGAVEEATAVEVNAGTQTGSEAELFINPLYMPAKHIVGALSNAVAKTYVNFQLLFTLWTGSTSGALTTDFPNWIRSTGAGTVFVPPLGATVDFQGTGADYIVTNTTNTNSFFSTGANTFLLWTQTNIVVLDFFAKFPASFNNDVNLGFTTTQSEITATYSAATFAVGRATFSIDNSTGKLYATMGNTTASSQVDISSGLTLTTWNNFRIELHLGTDAKFYVNGVLKATISTNLPNTASRGVNIGFGKNNVGNTVAFQVTAPTVSLQLI